MGALPNWLWGCDAFALLAAAYLFYLGRNRRVGVEPHCRKCGYLLRGLRSQRCPECGSELIAINVVQGEATRRWTAIIAAAIVLSLVVTSTAIYRQKKGLLPVMPIIKRNVPIWQNTNPYANKPNAFVLKDLNSGRPPQVWQAWNELRTRELSQQLSANDRYNMARFALDQLKAIHTPHRMFTDLTPEKYLEARMFAGDLPAEQKEKLFEQAVRPKLEVGQNNVNGGILYYVVKFDWPSFPDCAMELQTPMVCIDGKEVDLPNKPDFGSTAFIGEIAMSSGSWYRHPTAGSHELEVTLRMQLYRERIGSIPVYDINRKLTAGFEIPIAKPNPTSINH